MDRVAINTRMANVRNIIKKMKNIQPDSEIYFNATVKTEKYPTRVPFDTRIKVWDRLTGRIYRDTPFIRSLFVGDVDYDRGISFGDPRNANTYNTRYSLFVQCDSGSWSNGYT